MHVLPPEETLQPSGSVLGLCLLPGCWGIRLAQVPASAKLFASPFANRPAPELGCGVPLGMDPGVTHLQLRGKEDLQGTFDHQGRRQKETVLGALFSSE